MPTENSPAPAKVSLEYFPPKGVSAERSLMTGAHALRRFQPAYQTVTFGADGAATEGSLEWSSNLAGLTDIPTASHITLCRFDRDGFLAHADALWHRGIERLVVLRGDVEEGQGNGLAGYNSVAEAIADLKKHHPWDISVSAYPEPHPKAISAAADLDVLLAKQSAGADRAITQYFFNNEDFYRFRDRAEKAGFRKELVPGVIPIVNFERIKVFSKRCGASVPADFEGLFARAGDDKSLHTDVAREIVQKQVRDLARNGVDAIHIYTLNRVDLTADAIRAFYAEFDGMEEADFLPRLVG